MSMIFCHRLAPRRWKYCMKVTPWRDIGCSWILQRNLRVQIDWSTSAWLYTVCWRPYRVLEWKRSRHLQNVIYIYPANIHNISNWTYCIKGAGAYAGRGRQEVGLINNNKKKKIIYMSFPLTQAWYKNIRHTQPRVPPSWVPVTMYGMVWMATERAPWGSPPNCPPQGPVNWSWRSQIRGLACVHLLAGVINLL